MTRPLVVVASLLAVIALLPAVAAAVEPRGIERVCPAPSAAADTDDGTAGEQQPQASFPDAGTTHADAIACAADYGLVSGFPDGTYRPGEEVTRGQMASFVAAWLRVATGFALPDPDEQPFTDVEPDATHATAIARIAEAGIVGGRGDGTFAPDEPLTRGQFAQVVVRAISYADLFAIDGPLPPPGDADEFSDVPGTTFETAIGALAGTGIAAGTGDGVFAPNAPVSRGQLATFLMRGADYLDVHQRWEPTARTAVLVADLRSVDTTGTDDDPVTDEVLGTATLQINAFDGTLFYIVELSGIPGPYALGSGATVHLGLPGEDGPVVIELADGEALDAAAPDRGVTGVVVEADSDVRFAALQEDPAGAYVQVATDAHPDGYARGQLTSAG